MKVRPSEKKLNNIGIQNGPLNVEKGVMVENPYELLKSTMNPLLNFSMKNAQKGISLNVYASNSINQL